MRYNFTIVIVGQKKTGKTTLAKRLMSISKLPKKLVFDPSGQEAWQDIPRLKPELNVWFPNFYIVLHAAISLRVPFLGISFLSLRTARLKSIFLAGSGISKYCFNSFQSLSLIVTIFFK